jgi:lipopolysaccharide transport system permease protein
MNAPQSVVPADATAGLDRRAGARRDRTVLVIRPPDSLWARMPDHLRRLPEYGDLLYTLSLHRINVRYRQTVLGVLWAVLQPVLMMLIFTVVFSMLARMPSDGVPYALFAYTALLPWTFFASSVTNATTSLVSHTQLITKVYFPREILPLTYVIVGFFDFAIGLVVLGALMTWFEVPFTLQILHLLPLLLLLGAWLLAVALFLSAAQVRWRDIGVAMPVLLQFWMFASPVIYPLSLVPEAWRSLYMLNPMTGIISSFRDVLLQGAQPEPVPLRYALVVTVCALPAAYLYFKRAEATMADVV